MLKNNFCVGCIIFQSLDNKDEFNHAVSCSGATLDSVNIAQINHVGLYIGNGQIIEATQKQGVIMRPLSAFLDDANENLITTINEPSLIAPAIARAKSYLGLPYNFSFHPDDKGLYCSQLITHAFKTHQGNDYFQCYPMNFRDATTQQILPYWINYYDKLKQIIPHDLPGSHPQQLLRQSSCFASIIHLKTHEMLTFA